VPPPQFIRLGDQSKTGGQEPAADETARASAPTPAEADFQDDSTGGKWLVYGLVGVLAIIILGAVIGGGLFLSSQLGGDEEDESGNETAKSTTEETIIGASSEDEGESEPGDQPSVDKSEEVVDEIDANARFSEAERLMERFYLEMKDENWDEAMAAVESGEVSPIASGIVYCAVIESCLEIFDIQRAQEWTYALNAWCESQLQLVPFRGQCLIRRSEILQLHGEWSAAIDEAYRASELLVKPLIEPSAGAAFYQLGELYRLQGDFAKADEAYRQASKCGRNPQPGLALLRLFQGQIETAAASIEFMMKETKDRITRSRMLLACVEIMLASRDIQKARIATNELVELASEFNASFLHATAAYAEGAVLLAEGNEQTALEKLRLGKKIWEDMKAPYQAARVRLLIGIACRQIGDEDTAELELEAAKFTFIQLKAKPDLDQVDTLMHDKIRGKTHGLSQRELQVLRLIAIGKSNKDIANDLFISERTVERHVSNIFNKLAVSSRSAATAYAYKRQLI